MKKQNVSVAKLFNNAKKEWKQANKSLMFTLNVMNNTIKGGGAPELKKYLEAIHETSKIQIDHLCKDSANNVCILSRVSDNMRDTLVDFMNTGANRLSLHMIGGHEYIVTPKGAVYKFVQLKADKGGFSFLDLITSLNDKMRVDSFGGVIVEKKDSYVADTRKEVNANYLTKGAKRTRTKGVTRPQSAKGAKGAKVA